MMDMDTELPVKVI